MRCFAVRMLGSYLNQKITQISITTDTNPITTIPITTIANSVQTYLLHVVSPKLLTAGGRTLAISPCPIRVWNGIFAVGDWRAKRGPEDNVSAQRPEIGDLAQIANPQKSP